MRTALDQYGAEAFCEQMKVYGGELADFKKLEKMLSGWNNSINLVQKASLENFWTRHLLDSYQLCEHLPMVSDDQPSCIDLGSGAGFPGLVLAIYMKHHGGGHMDLVEANGKKCSFLRAVVRELSLPVKIYQERAERLEPKRYDVISARAFAPLIRLCEYALPFWGANTIGIFPKGRNYGEEDKAAKAQFSYELTTKTSKSDPEGMILLITDLKPRLADNNKD